MAAKLKEYITDAVWLLTFVIFVFAVYEHASYKVVRSMKKLEKKKALILTQLEKEKALHIEQQTKIDSMNDPKWIELELIARLGLVPEGYKKIYIEEALVPPSEEKKP